MLNELQQILDYMIGSFLHTWPYLLVTIPIAVIVNMSGISKHLERAFTVRPVLAIFLATFVGAFSPLCACSVIPVVAAMLIGGVPLAPVMSFWLASPSMDPEIFFLTVSSLGWELAIWRMAGTLVLSLAGGFITHVLVERNLLGDDILRTRKVVQVPVFRQRAAHAWETFTGKILAASAPKDPAHLSISGGVLAIAPPQPAAAEGCVCSSTAGSTREDVLSSGSVCEVAVENQNAFNWQRLGVETWTATIMVIKFMLLAWLIGAVIRLYVPDSWVSSVLGGGNAWSIITAALLGIPVYTSNLTAMPLVGGLKSQGMHPAAALAFLIAGPTTTLPAMSAVWGIVNRKVFSLYIGYSLVGAVILGYGLYLFSMLN